MYVLTSTVKGNVSVVCASNEQSLLRGTAMNELKAILANLRESFVISQLNVYDGDDVWALTYNEDTKAEIILKIEQLVVI